MKECDICMSFDKGLGCMKTALTIAGSDSSGGAGIQADLKTFTVHGVYGMSVITAVTAQNTTGVYGIENVSAKMIEMQLDAVFSDIFPDAIKIGMVSDADSILAIAGKLREYNPKNIVVDTVMVSTSGRKLIDENAVSVLKSELLPMADIITPNIFEAQKLANVEISQREDMLKAAKIIANYTDAAVLIKGGHLRETADDLLYQNGMSTWFNKERINNDNTHGTGCTLSSAIGANLARGMNIRDAVNCAKEYVYGAIKDGMDLGKGSGPLNHIYEGMVK